MLNTAKLCDREEYKARLDGLYERMMTDPATGKEYTKLKDKLKAYKDYLDVCKAILINWYDEYMLLLRLNGKHDQAEYMARCKEERNNKK